MKLLIHSARTIDMVIVHLVVMLFAHHRAVVMVSVLMIVAVPGVVFRNLSHSQVVKTITMDAMTAVFRDEMLLAVQNVFVSGKVLHRVLSVN